MATLKLGEVVVDAVLAKLKAGYTARVTEINAEKADAYPIVAPDAAADYYFGGVSEIPRAPAVIVFQQPTNDEHEKEGPHSFIWVGVIGVRIVDEDTNRSALARKLQRHARATIEVLWDDAPQEALAGSAFRLRFVRDNPGPVSDPNDEQSHWRGFHDVFFQAWQSEN